MANLPEFLFEERFSSAEGINGGASTSETQLFHTPHAADLSNFSIENLILSLNDERTREHALRLLSQTRNMCDRLAVLIWHSFGTIYILLKEIMKVYHLLSKKDIPEKESRRVYNAIVLLQCVAAHPETRIPFMKAKIPVYLYPILNTTNKEPRHEHLRLMSLSVIGALVKVDDKEAIFFLLETEIVPYCLRCMDVGAYLSKTVATYILQKILMNDEGFRYCCMIADRFFAITHALEKMMERLVEKPYHRLLKHIINCYLKLSECPRACQGLGKFLPMSLTNGSIARLLRKIQSP